jgi:hypothetical protein
MGRRTWKPRYRRVTRKPKLEVLTVLCRLSVLCLRFVSALTMIKCGDPQSQMTIRTETKLVMLSFLELPSDKDVVGRFDGATRTFSVYS